MIPRPAAAGRIRQQKRLSPHHYGFRLLTIATAHDVFIFTERPGFER